MKILIVSMVIVLVGCGSSVKIMHNELSAGLTVGEILKGKKIIIFNPCQITSNFLFGKDTLEILSAAFNAAIDSCFSPFAVEVTHETNNFDSVQALKTLTQMCASSKQDFALLPTKLYFYIQLNRLGQYGNNRITEVVTMSIELFRFSDCHTIFSSEIERTEFNVNTNNALSRQKEILFNLISHILILGNDKK